MDTTRLRYFATVAKTGSIRAAAELLHVSPAAISKAIKVLEGELGVQLLIPSGRGILVTDLGSRLASRAQVLFDEMEALTTVLKTDEAIERPLRLGSFEVFTTYFVGPLLREHLGQIPLVLHEFVPGPLEEAIVQRKVDLGITYIPIPHEALDHLKVTHIEMGVYGKHDAFCRVGLDSLPFVVPVFPIQGSPTKVRGLDGWPEERVERKIRYRAAMMETALELCRQGLAVAYLPSFVVHLHNRLVKREYELQSFAMPQDVSPNRHPVYLVKRKTDEESGAAKKVARALRQLSRLHPVPTPFDNSGKQDDIALSTRGGNGIDTRIDRSQSGNDLST